jgi:phosphate transport system substrate-binding protein
MLKRKSGGYMMYKKTKRGFVVLTICLAFVIALSGCGSFRDAAVSETPEKGSPPKETGQSGSSDHDYPEDHITIKIPGLDAENYPRVDGSTANLPLIARLYSGITGVSLEEAENGINISGGTGMVWRNLMWDGADILIVYEAPEGILDEFAGNGIELEIEPIGRDGLVFLVNKANTVDNLTTEQLRGIYTGKITDWRDVGGDTGPISAFQRNQESGSQTLFLKLLMDGRTPMEPPKELIPDSMAGLIEAVASFDGTGGAIGYSVFYYADLMYANPDLKLLSVDGITPSFESIYSGEYPFINDFFVVIRADAQVGSPERILRDWLLTDEGTALLKAENYVPAK